MSSNAIAVSHEARRKRAGCCPVAQRHGFRWTPLKEEHGPPPVVVDASKPGGQNGSRWLVMVARRSHPHPAAHVGLGLAALESNAPDIMQTIWQVLATGMGVVMITTTIAAIIGLCVLLWWTRRID
jgi:hypothetical protein